MGTGVVFTMSSGEKWLDTEAEVRYVSDLTEYMVSRCEEFASIQAQRVVAMNTEQAVYKKIEEYGIITLDSIESVSLVTIKEL